MFNFQRNFNNNCEFIVCGDFNSRIGSKPDYVENDDLQRFDLLPDDYVVDIILPRTSQDKNVNENVKCLLDFCKMSGLKVLNGRVGKDSQIGKFTCVTSRGSSVIDLVMCTPLLFSCIDQFEVLDPNVLSDHCVVQFHKTSVKNNCCVNDRVINECDKVPHVFKWDSDKKDIYIQSFNNDRTTQSLINICNDIDLTNSSASLDNCLEKNVL